MIHEIPRLGGWPPLAVEIPDDTPKATRMRVAVETALRSGASLARASLDGASLARASLARASLARASLDGAIWNADGAKLVGKDPLLILGPLGSRGAYLVCARTARGLCLRTGCFDGDEAAFVAAVEKTHGEGAHGRAYRAAVAFARQVLVPDGGVR